MANTTEEKTPAMALREIISSAFADHVNENIEIRTIIGGDLSDFIETTKSNILSVMIAYNSFTVQGWYADGVESELEQTYSVFLRSKAADISEYVRMIRNQLKSTPQEYTDIDGTPYSLSLMGGQAIRHDGTSIFEMLFNVK